MKGDILLTKTEFPILREVFVLLLMDQYLIEMKRENILLPKTKQTDNGLKILLQKEPMSSYYRPFTIT